MKPRRVRTVAFLFVGVWAVLAIASTLIGGCGNPAITVTSPKVTSHIIFSSSRGTEQSQRVDLRVTFDRPVLARRGAVGDLVLTVDGAELSEKMAVVSVVQIDAKTLAVSIAAAPGVTGATGNNYFALSYGELSVRAVAKNGVLPHVAGSDGAPARWTAIKCRVPSGLVISVMSSLPGSSSEQRPATATFRIVTTPQIRVVSWLEMQPGGKQVLVHDHDFLACDAECYAQQLAASLNAGFSGDYKFVAKGDTVMATATKNVGGQKISPAVCLGDL